MTEDYAAPQDAVAKMRDALDARGIELTWADLQAAANAAAAPIAARALNDYRDAILDNPSSEVQSALDVADDIREWINLFIQPDGRER